MEIDWKIVDTHRQIYEYSCIPSAIEMILKLLKKVGTNYYVQQCQWNNKACSFRNFNGKTIEGLTFKLVNGLLIEELFEEIDRQLKAKNFIIISLKSVLIDPKSLPNNYHMYIIYEYCDNDYKAFTKIWQDTKSIINVKEIVKKMENGTTDILVYS